MLYFASARTTLNKSNESLSLPSSSFPIAKLKTYLLEKYDGNEELKKVLNKSALSLNEEIVYDEDDAAAGEVLLKEGDVVAIIPPVSGG